jgi:hypothetical protein
MQRTSFTLLLPLSFEIRCLRLSLKTHVVSSLIHASKIEFSFFFKKKKTPTIIGPHTAWL